MYVDLFSNSSLDVYPNNTVSSFTVKLDHPIDLEGGEYEVALAQLICPAATQVSIQGKIVIETFPKDGSERDTGDLPENSILNSIPDSLKIYPKGKSFFGPNYVNTSSISIPRVWVHDLPKDIASSGELLTYLNNLLKGSVESSFKKVVSQRGLHDQKPLERKHPAHIQYNASGLTIHVRDSDFTVTVSGSIARMLGFDVSEDHWVVLLGGNTYTFPDQRIDLKASRVNLLSVYSSLVLSHRVGHTSAPLLRTVTLPKASGSVVGDFLSFEFDSLHYLPVATKYIQEIGVQCRGNDGQLVPFRAGIMYLRLHFQSRRQ